MDQKELDIINKPMHYHSGAVDPIRYSSMHFSVEQNIGFYRVNIIKYVTRYDKKNGLEDLKKARFYLDKLIDTVAANE